AISGAGGRTHLHLHQPLGGKADHLAQEIGVGGLLHQRAQVHHVVGHRCSFRKGVGLATRPYRKAPMTAALPSYTTSGDVTPPPSMEAVWCIIRTEASNMCRSSIPSAWPKRASSPPSAASATLTTTLSPRRSTACTRPK